MSKIPEIKRINLETKATNFIKTYNTKGRLLDKPKAILCYEEFLKEKIKNPVGMDIAMRDVLRREPVEDMIEFSSNVAYIEQNKGIKTLLKELYSQEAKRGKTQDLKEALIENNRINHDRITPALKGFNKFILMLKLLIL